MKQDASWVRNGAGVSTEVIRGLCPIRKLPETTHSVGHDGQPDVGPGCPHPREKAVERTGVVPSPRALITPTSSPDTGVLHAQCSRKCQAPP